VVRAAEAAELVQLQPIRVRLLVLGGDVVALLAATASPVDDDAQVLPLSFVRPIKKRVATLLSTGDNKCLRTVPWPPDYIKAWIWLDLKFR
jgi:hypothetical protein